MSNHFTNAVSFFASCVRSILLSMHFLCLAPFLLLNASLTDANPLAHRVRIKLNGRQRKILLASLPDGCRSS